MAEPYKYEPLDSKEYAKLIKNASYTTFYNSPERLQFIDKRNRKTGYFKISNKRGPVALVSYQVIPARSGSFVYFQHSPIFIDTSVAEDINFWKELKNLAIEIGDKEQAIYVRFTPRIPNNKDLTAELHTLGFKKAPVQELDSCVTRIINIQDFNNSSMSSEQMKRLERAEKNKWSVTFSESKDALENFAATYRTLAAKKLIDYVPLDYLREELEAYLDNKQLIIADIRDEKDSLFASAAIVNGGDTAWYYWAAITEQGAEKGADTLMLHNTIEYLRGKKIRVLDLWGGSISKEVEEKGLPHPWKEMDSFKKGFGASRVEYLPAIDLAVKPPQYLAAVFYQRALMTKRGYPYLPLN